MNPTRVQSQTTDPTGRAGQPRQAVSALPFRATLLRNGDARPKHKGIALSRRTRGVTLLRSGEAGTAHNGIALSRRTRGVTLLRSGDEGPNHNGIALSRRTRGVKLLRNGDASPEHKGIALSCRTRGVTLIEVMVASLILVVGLMGLTSAWVYGMQLTRKTDETAAAYNIARSRIESARQVGLVFLPYGTTDQYFDASGNQLPGQVGAYFHASVLVRRLGRSLPQLNQKEVRVSVDRISDGTVLFETRSMLMLGGS